MKVVCEGVMQRDYVREASLVLVWGVSVSIVKFSQADNLVIYSIVVPVRTGSNTRNTKDYSDGLSVEFIMVDLYLAMLIL